MQTISIGVSVVICDCAQYASSNRHTRLPVLLLLRRRVVLRRRLGLSPVYRANRRLQRFDRSIELDFFHIVSNISFENPFKTMSPADTRQPDLKTQAQPTHAPERTRRSERCRETQPAGRRRRQPPPNPPAAPRPWPPSGGGQPTGPSGTKPRAKPGQPPPAPDTKRAPPSQRRERRRPTPPHPERRGPRAQTRRPQPEHPPETQ